MLLEKVELLLSLSRTYFFFFLLFVLSFFPSFFLSYFPSVFLLLDTSLVNFSATRLLSTSSRLFTLFEIYVQEEVYPFSSCLQYIDSLATDIIT